MTTRGEGIVRWVHVMLLLGVAYVVIVRGYGQPARMFWDENYYLASAYKTMQGVFYMEPHPPLGKLFIALGETMLHPNRGLDTGYFLGTDYVRETPPGFSFEGLRLFPVLFAWACTPLVYLILLELSRRPTLSLLFASTYLFENAFLVHNRAAMLDSCLLFFSLAALWKALRMGTGRAGVRDFMELGMLVGCAWATKLNTAVLILLVLLPAFHQPGLRCAGRFVPRALAFLAGATVVFGLIFYVHIARGQRVVAGATYTASPTYRQLIQERRTGDPRFFPRLLIEQCAYIPHYHHGVPRYDASKPGENGSPPYLWPLGRKAINYRWDQEGDRVRYSYLQVNPVSWYAGLCGVLLAGILIGGRAFYGLRVANPQCFKNALFLFALYGGYMLEVLSQNRVMYLYHYFLPQILSLFLFFNCVLCILADRLDRRPVAVLAGFALFALADGATFGFFCPLTYHQPLTEAQFARRNWLPLWGLAPVHVVPAAQAQTAPTDTRPVLAAQAGNYQIEKITDPVVCLRLAAAKGDQASVDHYLDACIQAAPEVVEPLRMALVGETNRAVAKMLAHALARIGTPESLKALQDATDAITNADISDVVRRAAGFPAQKP